MKKCLKFIHIQLFFALLFFQIVQTIDIVAQSLYFNNLGIEDGLPSGVANSIVQDKHGFIWIGTQEGLCRYDGYKITVFKNQPTSASIPTNNISTLLLDGKMLWVGTWGGLCTVDIENFAIKRVNIGGARAIRALYKDKEGNIWIGTSNGLIVYNKSQDRYLFYDSTNSQISHNTIRCFFQTKNGDMWIGTYNGINRFRNSLFSNYNLKGQYKPLLKNNLICSLTAYSDSNDSLLWVGTETGLCLLNTITGTFVSYNSLNTNLSNEVIKCIYRQNDSILWLGTDFGLNIFNINSKKSDIYYHDPLVNKSISNNVIWQIFEDDKKRLWFITSNGVSLFDNHENLYKFHEEYYSLNYPKIGNQIRDILVDKAGNVWLASLFGVICHIKSTGETIKYTENSNPNQKILLNNVYVLEEDMYGRIWIGTAGGLNILDQNTKQMYSVSTGKNNGLTSNYISSFTRQNDSSIWLSAWEGGLFKVIEGMDHPESMKFIQVDDDGDGRVINAGERIFYGSHKDLWLIDKNTFEKKAIDIVNRALKDKEISSIVGDSNGNIWLGAENTLLHYNHLTQKLDELEIKLGVSNKLISLLLDNSGIIWASTHNSIIRIEPKTGKYFTIPINRNSPLKSFYYHCAALSPQGLIFFGGDNGYIEIDPLKIKMPGITPSVFLTNLFVNNQFIFPLDSLGILNCDIAFCKSILLKHNQNSFTLEFSTLDYLFPEVTQYAYHLKNYDKDWHFTSGTKNFAVYSNLSPGDYIFEVKGTNHFGIWSKPASLVITIKPPFWLGTWFLILYLILFSGLSYLIYRIFKYRHKINQELRIAKLEKQHAEELFKAKQQFFTNISHEFRTPLSLILPPIQQVLKSEITNAANRKLLKLAKRNSQRLYKLINQLLDFGKIESSRLSLNLTHVELVSLCKFVYGSFKDLARRNEINYQFNSEIKSLYTDIDVDKFETILFNLLSNAFKYTLFSGSIELCISELEQVEDKWIVEIKVIDTGIGIAKNEQEHIFERFYQTTESKALNLGSGIGLTMAQEYARLHDGIILVESQPDKGSTFTIKIPLLSKPEFESNPEKEIHSLPYDIVQNQLTGINQSLKKILIIDDNEDILDYIEMNLVNQYTIYRATNGQEGFEMMQKNQPHLIISDIMMPVMDGIDLCSRIKKNQAFAHIPVILLTAKTLPEQKTIGMNSGADLYITKPFDIDYFKSCVASIFRREEQILKYIKCDLLLKPDSTGDPDKNQDEIFLKKVMAIIEKNIGNSDFSVEILSESVAMSTTHLYRRLKQLTNQSTMDIIKNYRMQKAAQMIKNNEGNITEIMYSVGFSSLSSFSKSFKSVFNVSPSMYSEQFGKDS